SAGVQTLAMWGLKSVLTTLAPILGIALCAGLLANVLQMKLRFSPVGLKPSLSKLNPAPGFKRLASKNTVVEMLKAMSKTAVVAPVAFFAVKPKLGQLGGLVGVSPAALPGTIGPLVLGIAIRVLVAFLILAAADYAWQRRQFEEKLKMSKEEVKQEHKQQEVSPEVKRAMRRRQMEQARKRMMAAVPTADVIVTNPT